jgi:hypothetical protein
LNLTTELLGQLDEATNNMSRLRDAFFQKWQLPNENTVSTAKDELKVGKFRTL